MKSVFNILQIAYVLSLCIVRITDTLPNAFIVNALNFSKSVRITDTLPYAVGSPPSRTIKHLRVLVFFSKMAAATSFDAPFKRNLVLS